MVANLRKHATKEQRLIVLGVETSSLACGVALAQDDRVLGELLIAGEEPVSERLIEFLDMLLRESRLLLEDLSGFAISIGPGSFTGLRVGLSTLKGLCLATSKPLVKVPTLDALVFGLSYVSHRLCPVIDARRGEVYAALYRARSGAVERLSPYLALKPSELVERIEDNTLFLGSGADIYRDLLLKALGKKAHFLSPNPPTPKPSSIALLGISKLLKGETEEVDGLEPLYLRPSQAELKLEEKK